MCLISKKVFKNFFMRKPSDSYEDYIKEGMDREHYLNFMYSRLHWYNAQDTEDIYIKSYDNLKLYASYLSCENSKNYVIFFHSLNGRGVTDFASVAEFYKNNGFNTIMTDQRTHGKSEGTYKGFGSLERNDVLSWVNYAIERFGDDINIFLHGVSCGASTILMASNMGLPKNVKAIVSDCGFTSLNDIVQYIKDSSSPKLTVLTNIILKNMARMFKKKIGYDVDEFSTITALKQNDIPVLFIHGDKDSLVPFEMTQKNFKACRAEKELLCVKGAEHAKSHYLDTKAYENAIKCYIDKYIPRTIVSV